jgi:hypothetical protein
MSVTDDQKLAILHEHYNESFNLIRKREEQRDFLFFILIVVFVILILQIQYPANFGGAIGKVSILGAEIDLNKIPLAPLLNASWTLCFVVALKYAQTTLIIERQYPYLHNLEEKISSLLNDSRVYIREGKSYFHNYRSFQDWIWFCYTVLLPIVVAFATITLMIVEWQHLRYSIAHKIFDTVIAVAVLISFFLYRTIPQFINLFKKHLLR